MNIANYIDHTVLKPNTTEGQIRKLCAEAKEHYFVSVCVNPTWVKLCSDLLVGTDVKVCTVIGFPLGANMPETKAFEAKLAVEQGADEVDMVINVGALKSGNLELVERDIQAVRDAAPTATLKVIIEICLLTDDEKVMACQLSQKVGADFVKTSTGFSTGGATIEDIRLMRNTVGLDMGVKASGGIKDFAGAQAMIMAGATRLGCSAGVAIMLSAKN
ncbi:MAG: deoxyribose-phosphate aldolase [Candidatus Magasanikbacteria bacterium]|nr:deoxyribose-phosphate aldolase [Candidatus Magasanikbacteria bacterium]